MCVCKLSGRCLEVVQGVSVGCLNGVLRVSRRCLEFVRIGQVRTGQVRTGQDRTGQVRTRDERDQIWIIETETETEKV